MKRGWPGGYNCYFLWERFELIKKCFMGFSYYKSNVSLVLVTSTMIFWTDYKLLKRKTMLLLGRSRRYNNSTVIITKCRHAMLYLTKWVILRIFDQKQELVTLSENLGSPRFFGGIRIANGSIVFCVAMFVLFVFLCPMLHVSLKSQPLGSRICVLIKISYLECMLNFRAPGLGGCVRACVCMCVCAYVCVPKIHVVR